MFLVGQCHFRPSRREQIARIHATHFGSKPHVGVAHNFVRIWVQIRGPPTERAIGDDIMVAIAHQQHLLPVRHFRRTRDKLNGRVFGGQYANGDGDRLDVWLFEEIRNTQNPGADFLDDMVDGANIVGDWHNRVAILFGRIIADAKMDGNGWHDRVWVLVSGLFFAEVQHADDFVVVFCEIHVGLEIAV